MPNTTLPIRASIDSAPGTTVATRDATWSDGSPFTGTLRFSLPYGNDQGKFAISGNNLIINPAGPGRRR